MSNEDWQSKYQELLGRYNQIINMLASVGLELQIMAKKAIEAQMQQPPQPQPKKK